MSTFQLTGNVTTTGEAPGQEVILILSVPDTVAPIISYSTSSAQSGGVPQAQLSLPTGALAFLNGEDLAVTPHSIDTFIIEAVWAGNTTQLMYFHFVDAFDGDFQEWTFEVGGTLLPRTGNGIDIEQWTSQLTSANLISSGPLQPNTIFNINQVFGVEQVSGISFTGDTSSEQMRGGYDNDTLSGLGGDDTLRGGDGNDLLRGGKQEDLLQGGNGNDQLFGQRNADVLDGNAGEDRLNAGGGNDTLNGGDGDDFLKGGTRDDVLNGGKGNDEIIGNSGADTLNGGNGNDKLNAGGDNDRLNGGSGNDTLKGGSGEDTFIFSTGHGDDTIQDFTTDDVINLSNVSTLSDFADVQDAARNNNGGVLIDTGAGNSIFLEDVARGDLTADDFAF